LDEEDRRQFVRFDINLPIKFFDITNNRIGVAKSHDICAKGIGFTTDTNLNKGTELEIWLDVPDGQRPIYTKGNVVWSMIISQDLYRVGVYLEKVDFLDLSRILRIGH